MMVLVVIANVLSALCAPGTFLIQKIVSPLVFTKSLMKEGLLLLNHSEEEWEPRWCTCSSSHSWEEAAPGVSSGSWL